MSKKRKVVSLLVIIVGIILNILILKYERPALAKNVYVDVTLNEEKETDYQVYYLLDKNSLQDFSEVQSDKGKCTRKEDETRVTFQIPAGTKYIRFDIQDMKETLEIKDISVRYADAKYKLPIEEMKKIELANEIEVEKNQDSIQLSDAGEDAYIVWNTQDWKIVDTVKAATDIFELVIKVILCIVIDIILYFVLRYAKGLVTIPVEIIQNRKLIFNLAKNDFKTQYAGSYLGIFWAFVQPIVTVVVYWFVFEKGLKAGEMNTKAGITVPFVLWLIAGIVPWFFFQDALIGAMNALTQYSYLVKKVVFNISILPVVKIISAIFVHLFFLFFTVVLYMAYGKIPDLYMLQIFYYSFCILVLVLGISYATCAIVGFFRDLTQIVSIVLQVGIWMTPIMWNIDTINISPKILSIFKLNPMYYIVAGYRDALINKVWFWEHPELTVYFWVLTVILFGGGLTIFKKLRVHFADVL